QADPRPGQGREFGKPRERQGEAEGAREHVEESGKSRAHELFPLDGERAAEVHDLRRAERQGEATDSEAGRPGPRQDREGGESDGRERNQRNEATLRVEKLLQDDGSSEPGPQSERESEERV